MPDLKLVPAAAPKPPENPTPARKRRTKREPQHLQPDELARFFCVIDSPRDRAIFQLMYRAGLRASEIGLLELRDYNTRTERIMIHRLKGSNSGEHHCCRVLSRVMQAWLKARGKFPGPLFPSNRRTGIRRSNLDVLMKKYGEASGLAPKLRHCHVFKHTCATDLLDLGLGIADVQDWLGHANIQSTAIYAKITNRRRLEMGERLKETWK